MKIPRPKGAGAVMAAHAPAVVEADDTQTALYRALQFFPTPPWAARAGGELIQRLDPGPWTCWEPACGRGHMAHGLTDYFPEGVGASDIHDHGYGAVIDFLDPALESWPASFAPDFVVSNPPFDQAAAFVARGLARARRGVAMLCRLAWFESAGRYDLFFGDQPLAVFAPFFERVPMTLGVWDPKASTATAYAWFVWFTPDATPAWLNALRASGAASCVTVPIGPGTKARLTRASDARLFGKAQPAPLFHQRTSP